VPVVQAPVHFDFFNSTDLSGPVVSSQQLPNTEQMWIGQLPEGIAGTHFSARATLRYVAQKAGTHQFSLISAGLSRAYINGELVLDAWTHWSRGETYFTFGCEEVMHERVLGIGEVCDIRVEYSSATPEDIPFRALRFGAHRMLDNTDVTAAVEAARSADVAIVFAGLNAEWDNEGLDRHNIQLPHRQNELIARVAAANPRTIVVLQTGSPVALPWLDQVSSVLQAWYPGQECGNAIADVLLGSAEPGGRLPQTWPMRLTDMVGHGSQAQYPGVDGHVRYDEGIFIGYRHYQRAGLAVQFPFGHGLSYTRFEYGELRGLPASIQPGDAIALEVDVRNTGARAGQAVLQLFVSDEESSVVRPSKELKAFAKVHLEAGEKGTARMTLTMRALAFYDTENKVWRAEAGVFTLHLGTSVDEILASVPLKLLHDWTST
jgi:beta-glucosidase